jgi:hypothetical protein
MASSDTCPDNRFTTFPACIFNSIDEWGSPVVEITGNPMLLNEVKQKSSERQVEYRVLTLPGTFLRYARQWSLGTLSMSFQQGVPITSKVTSSCS